MVEVPNGPGHTTAPQQSDTPPRLDLEKLRALPSEQQGLYLLTFTGELLQYVTKLDEKPRLNQLGAIRNQLLEVVNIQTPFPSRIIRYNIGECYIKLLNDVIGNGLYDSINGLVTIVNGKEKEVKTKHAALTCLGHITESYGSNAVSLSSNVIAASLRLQKTAANHTDLRATIYKVIGKTIIGVGVMIDESSAREAWKASRSVIASDNSDHVVVNAYWCLEQLLKHTRYYNNQSDFEKLQSIIWKSLDSPSKHVRHGAVSCLASQLIKHFVERPVENSLPKKTKKTKAKGGKDADAEDEDERPQNPLPLKDVLALTLQDILRLLSNRYAKAATSNRARAGITICLRIVLQCLGEAIIDGSYALLISHLSNNLQPEAVKSNRYRELVTRKHIRIILNHVVHPMLSEGSQVHAAQSLINEVLKDYPQTLNERPEPTKSALLIALIALENLIFRLGSAVQAIADACREAILQVLQHPSYTIQVYAARCMKALVAASPSHLLSCITLCMNSVGREVNLLGTGRQSPRRCIGYAHGLAALLSASAQNPLYGSVDVYVRVLDQATALLRSSKISNVKISAAKIQVAWTMLGGLMTLGPNFIKTHLPQLLLLWRNALPPPPSRDEIQDCSMIDQSFLSHVRECALSSIVAFLNFNSRLVTPDVAKRLTTMLQNTTVFMSRLPIKKTTEDIGARLFASLQLLDLDVMVRRRVFQCFTLLVMSNPLTIQDIVQELNVVSMAVSCFADPDNFHFTSLSTSIASSTGNFETIWDMGDNLGYGVTGLVDGFRLVSSDIDRQRSRSIQADVKTGPDNAIDAMLKIPMGEGWEHDGSANYLDRQTCNLARLPQPPATETINSAIMAFALAFPLQSPKVQESVLGQLLGYITSSGPSQDPARVIAVNVNVAAALLLTMRVFQGQTRGASGRFGGVGVERNLREVLHMFITDQDECIRNMAAETLGRLASVCSSDFTNSEISQLIDKIVTQREPACRAGCALALSYIHSNLGGMAASFHLKTMTSLIMSLAADQHPTVHYWALDSLSRLIDTAGLSFAGHVSGCIGLLSQLYLLDSHSVAAETDASSDLEMQKSTVMKLTQCVDAVINVLGPDLSDVKKPRDMILTLASQFKREKDDDVQIESLRCYEHLAVFMPSYMNFNDYVNTLQRLIDSDDDRISNMALEGLGSLMRKNAQAIRTMAGEELEEKLWDMLDKEPSRIEIKDIFRNWMEQDGLGNCYSWVRRCNRILTRPRKRTVPAYLDGVTDTQVRAVPETQDEEVAGFAAAVAVKEDEAASSTPALALMRWQVRHFAMDLLSELVSIVAHDVAANDGSVAQKALQQAVGEMIKIAFSASTAGEVELRLSGLGILDKILKMFGSVPDPDFMDAMLLEQYQAQISSALTPAFAADSSPQLAAQAVNVCATFVATGIVTDVERMGRIHKLLVSSLESFAATSDAAEIGELKGLTSNTRIMVRLAVFSAWADLQVASANQKYLEDVVKPHLVKLTPLWLSSLNEYARLRFEPEAGLGTGADTIGHDIESVYASLNRDILLKFYQESWLKQILALASLIDTQNSLVFLALDGKSISTAAEKVKSDKVTEDLSDRKEPTAFFFILFGIVFESLTGRYAESNMLARNQRLDTLHSLKCILRLSVAGNAVYQLDVFSELMDLLDRMILTEGVDIQTMIVGLARDLSVAHPSCRRNDYVDGENEVSGLSDDIDQLFELTRIIVLVLAGLIPGVAESNRPIRADITNEGVILVRFALEALVDVAAVFPTVIQNDLHACVLHLFTTIIGTASCQAAVVPTALPIFRRFLESITSAGDAETSNQLTRTLSRLLVILKNAQKRENEASLPCEKNTILAGTILLTTAHSICDVDDPNISDLVFQVADSLDNLTTAIMAAGCARSLLLIPGKSSCQQSIKSNLIPRLIHFLITPSDLIEDLADAASVVAQSLVTWTVSLYTSTPSSSKDPLVVAYNLVMPVLLQRTSMLKNYQSASIQSPTLAVDATPSSSVYNRWTSLCARLFLELATANQATFKAVIPRLDTDMKIVLETVLKSGNTGKHGHDISGRKSIKHGDDGNDDDEGDGDGDEGGHTIALKMNF